MNFVYGRSTSRITGDYVIISADLLDGLEADALVARKVLERAKGAKTLGEFEELLADLPYRASVNTEVLYDPAILPEGYQDLSSDPQDAPLNLAIWHAAIESMFFDGATGTEGSELMIDCEACYSSVAHLQEVGAWLRVATFDNAAAFNEIDQPIEALNAAGHTVVKDDERIRQVFTHFVRDAFIVPDPPEFG